MKLNHTHFRDVGFTVAACTDCDWSARRPVRAQVEDRVRRHIAEEPDHRVIVRRVQTKVVRRG